MGTRSAEANSRQGCREGGWIDKPGAICLNLYRPPTISRRRRKAQPWLDHVRKIFPNDAEHIIFGSPIACSGRETRSITRWFSAVHRASARTRCSNPSSAPSGRGTSSEVSPSQMLGRFNGFLKSVILRVSEARDLGEGNTVRPHSTIT